MLRWRPREECVNESQIIKECCQPEYDEFVLILFSHLSFQSDFSLKDKTTLVKSVSDTDAKLLVVLPKGALPKRRIKRLIRLFQHVYEFERLKFCSCF